MTYITREMMKEREDLTEATKFLGTEAGQDRKLLAFLNDLTNNRNTLYYRKNLKFYVYCQIMDWFLENDFLHEKKGDGRALIAGYLATKVCLEIGAKNK